MSFRMERDEKQDVCASCSSPLKAGGLTVVKKSRQCPSVDGATSGFQNLRRAKGCGFFVFPYF